MWDKVQKVLDIMPLSLYNGYYMMKKGEISMKSVKKLLEKRALWNKKHIPMPLVNWMAPAFVGAK